MSHSSNSSESFGLPLALSLVGSGAGRVTDSQRRMAGSYSPHLAGWRTVASVKVVPSCPLS